MKGYRQLISEIKSRKVVFAFGRFQPPTIGHELLVKAVQRIAQEQGADHVIFASKSEDKKSNPLNVKDKVYFLKRMFSSANFMAAGDNTRTFIEVAKELNKKYKSIVMVGGSDRVAEFKRILTTYNGKEFHYDSIEVKSAGERDPDSDSAAGMSGTKMRMAAKDGDFTKFKTGLPSTLTAVDARRLFNKLRSGMGLEAIKEEVEFERDTIREDYHAGKILHIGEQVVDKSKARFEIVDRGSNYVTVVDTNGQLHRKWIYDVSVVSEQIKVSEDIHTQDAPTEIEFKGYKTNWLHHSKEATDAFMETIKKYQGGIITDAVAILNAIKATDSYMKIADDALEAGDISKEKYEEFASLQTKARESLERINEWLHHEDYWHAHQHEMQQMALPPQVEVEEEFNITEERLAEMKFNTTDKIKVARIIGMSLGVDGVEKMSNGTQIVNAGLRKLRGKRITPEMRDLLSRMLNTAKTAGIEYDERLVPQAAQEMKEETVSFMTYHQFRQEIAKTAKETEEPKTTPVVHPKTGHGMDSNPRMAHRKAYHKMHEDLELSEAADKEHPIYKEYVGLKKLDIKQLRDMIKRQQRVVDTSEYRSKDHAASAILRHKHGNKKVDAAFGLKEEALEEASVDSAEKAAEIADLRARQAREKHDLVKKHQRERDELKEEEDKEDDVEFGDEDFDDEINSIEDAEHIIHLYDEDELAIVDDEGNEVEDDDDDEEDEQVNEALSRMERIKRKVRFARTKSKRERRRMIAVKRRSTQPVINRRARKHAILMLKKRLARKPLDKLSVQEKERLERIVQQRKKLVDRLAVRLAPKIRKIESERLRHQKFTKEEVDRELNELSTDLLSRYKKKASDQASAADKAGDFKKGDKRFSGIVKATKKQFANDMRKYSEEVELDEMTQGKEYTHDQLKKKIQSGQWEATHDIKPGKHVEMRHHSGKKVTVYVKEDLEESKSLKDIAAAAELRAGSVIKPKAKPAESSTKKSLSDIRKSAEKRKMSEEIEEFISDEEFEQILQMEGVTVEYATEEETAQFDTLLEAEYQGRDVPLNKPMAGDVKKSKVYVKDPDTGNVIKVNFGDKNMTIKKSNPERRRSFRARHKCDTANDKTTPRYWSCKAW